MKTKKHINEIISYAINGMAKVSEGQEACDLHHELFNVDYFIIGYYQAEQFLVNGPGVFSAIEEIQEYEKSNFGEITTDLGSSEKVVNMYAYIKGEDILNDCPTIQKRWNEKLTARDIKAIIKELKAQL